MDSPEGKRGAMRHEGASTAQVEVRSPQASHAARDVRHRDRERGRTKPLHEIGMLGVEVAECVEDAGPMLLGMIREILHLRWRDLRSLLRRHLRRTTAGQLPEQSAERPAAER
jgi:hypothetical protein